MRERLQDLIEGRVVKAFVETIGLNNFKMGPNSRRSIRSKSSPRGMGLRKPNTISNYRNRKAVFADQKQVETLHKGYQALDGGGEGSADTANGLNNLTYRKAPMKVAVRIRPLNARETTANAR